MTDHVGIAPSRRDRLKIWIKDWVRTRFGYEIVPSRAPDITDSEHATIAAVRDRTLVAPEQIAMLCRSVEYVVTNAIPGAFVECGVWRGGAVMAMLRTLVRLKETSRDIYLYDTFAGMTAPSPEDVSWDGRRATDLHAARDGHRGGSRWAYASLEDVREGIASTDYPAARVHYVKGLVEETIPRRAPEEIALLRLDTDWYESTRHELVHLFPRLARGGVLIIDDYGWWLGAKKAVDEYVAQHGLRLLLVRADPAVRYAVKIDAGPEWSTAPR